MRLNVYPLHATSRIVKLNMVSPSPTKIIKKHHSDVFDEFPKDIYLDITMGNIF
jgi:hypothetical protein